MTSKKIGEPLEGIEFAEILYADDTFIFGNYIRNINKIIEELQKQSEYYNLKLNLGKCINLKMNRKQSHDKFKGGNLIDRKGEAIYLGAILNELDNNAIELNNRIAAALKSGNKLQSFWNKAETNIK